MKKDIFLYRFDIEVGIFRFLYLKKHMKRKLMNLSILVYVPHLTSLAECLRLTSWRYPWLHLSLDTAHAGPTCMYAHARILCSLAFVTDVDFRIGIDIDTSQLLFCSLTIKNCA